MSMIAMLPLLLAATPVAGERGAVQRPVTRVASASVTIVQAERIATASVEDDIRKSDRQLRQKESRALVEFF